jgi:hypothetical protein
VSPRGIAFYPGDAAVGDCDELVAIPIRNWRRGHRTGAGAPLMTTTGKSVADRPCHLSAETMATEILHGWLITNAVRRSVRFGSGQEVRCVDAAILGSSLPVFGTGAGRRPVAPMLLGDRLVAFRDRILAIRGSLAVGICCGRLWYERLCKGKRAAEVCVATRRNRDRSPPVALSSLPQRGRRASLR